MVSNELKKIFLGFGIGTLFIVLSGLLTGGVLFADFLLSLKLSNNFIIFGVPYGFVAGIIYSLFLKFRDIKAGIFFGVGFWLSFSILYVIMYFAFSRFQIL